MQRRMEAQSGTAQLEWKARSEHFRVLHIFYQKVLERCWFYFPARLDTDTQRQR